MVQIYEQLARTDGLQLESDARDALLEHFREKEGNSRYGNARGVRNDFEDALVRHANRVAPMIGSCLLSDHYLNVLKVEDVINIDLAGRTRVEDDLSRRAEPPRMDPKDKAPADRGTS
jgi:hypothetical protein